VAAWPLADRCRQPTLDLANVATQRLRPAFSLLQFYATAPYTCSYLPGESARSQVATPSHLITSEVYGELVRSGFRRSGVFTYRPKCDDCQACVPVRVPVERFQRLNRSQRRSVRMHAGLQARELPLAFYDEHYQLYLRYQSARHAGGGMDQDSHEQYTHFLLQSRVDTRLIEFTMTALCCAWSASSTCSAMVCRRSTPSTTPTLPPASLGTYNIVWQIAQCVANRAALPVPGLLDSGQPQDGLQGRIQADRGLFDGQWIDALGELETRLAAVVLVSPVSALSQLAANCPLLRHRDTALAAISACGRGDRTELDECLRAIPFRSPYRDLRFILKALLVAGDDPMQAAELIARRGRRWSFSQSSRPSYVPPSGRAAAG
jgi:arginyl-tRNA--protein-N-Asp/Glu arginylyltransferase